MHTDAPVNSVFDGPVTTLLSLLCILLEVLSRALAKKGKSLNGFKVGTSVGRFSSDGAASTAVKGGLITLVFMVVRLTFTVSQALRWGIADAEIKTRFAENPEL